MDKRKLLIIIIGVIIVIGLGVATKIFFLDSQTNSISALRVDSFPQATVYLNDKEVGQTPYSNQKLTPGEYKLKIVVTGIAGTFFPYETKIKLTADSLTYVSRDVGKDEQSSGGQILWLEKLPGGQTGEIAIISQPDGAKVKIDGDEKGTTSIIIKDLKEGDHEVAVSLPSYSDQIIKARIIPSFRLNAAIKLATFSQTPVSPQELIATQSGDLKTETASSSAQTPIKPYVLIEETGTGFLRVRTDPSTQATESARVKPGETYPLLSETNGWVKIKIASSSGWVSDRYVQKMK